MRLKITDEVLHLWRLYQEALAQHGADSPLATDIAYAIAKALETSRLLGTRLDEIEEQIHLLAYPDPKTRPPRLSTEQTSPLED